MAFLINKQKKILKKKILERKTDLTNEIEHIFSLPITLFQEKVDQFDTKKLEMFITKPPGERVRKENEYIKFSYVLEKLTGFENYQVLLHTCLDYAVAVGNKKLTSNLFEKKGDVNYRNEEGETLLGTVLTHINYDLSDLESTKSREDMFRLLVKEGAGFLHLDFKNRNVIQIIHNEELDYLLPILEEYVPFFNEQQKNDWKIIQFSQMFK